MRSRGLAPSTAQAEGPRLRDPAASLLGAAFQPYNSSALKGSEEKRPLCTQSPTFSPDGPSKGVHTAVRAVDTGKAMGLAELMNYGIKQQNLLPCSSPLGHWLFFCQIRSVLTPNLETPHSDLEVEGGAAGF